MSGRPERILVADDEPLYLRTTGELLRRAGYECVCVSDGSQALERLRNESFDLLLSDLSMPGNFKLELLREHANDLPHVPIIVVTGVPTLPTAIEGIRLGIADYLLKPVKFEDLLASVRRALKKRRSQPDPSILSNSRPSSDVNIPDMLGRSQPMQELFELIGQVAETDTNVLITGESGTGKELVAKAIHQLSYRREGSFQVIDCTAIPDSLFESMLFGHKKGAFTGAIQDAQGLLKQSDGGTAFFDEIGELPAPLQAKLLRAVQEQTFIPVGSHQPVSVDTRIVCATNRDLEVEVQAGRFRQDLFYRLAVLHINVPPLRERGDDVVLLAQHFLRNLPVRVPGRESQPAPSLVPETVELLRRYPWPGNIRELRNTIEHLLALARGPYITPDHLPSKIQDTAKPATSRTDAWRPASSASASENSRASSRHSPSGTAPREPERAFPSEAGANANLDGASSDANRGVNLPPVASREEALRAAELQYLHDLMQRHEGNVSEAAAQAGLSRQALHNLLNKHELSASAYRK